jgi:very-short-patch-repair endonuclease
VSEEHDLNESVKKLGRLVPIIKDAQGNIIDGFHRQQLDPKWADEFSIKLDSIKDPIQLQLARMNINLCRRVILAEEKTQWLRELKELTGWNPKQIAEVSGMSERWVYQYLPAELKERPDVGGPKPVASPATQVIRPLIDCARCHLASRETTEFKGETLCPSCLEDAQKEPDRKPVEPTKISITVQKPKDTWEQRKAQMQVPVSKMEEAVLIKLEQKGVHPEVQKEFCLQRTRPDYYFPQQNLAIYLDGEVHKGREDRDEALRELLSKRYAVKVVTVTYAGSSETTEDSIVQQIMDSLEQ